MKKLMLLALSLCLVMVLAACGDDSAEKSDKKDEKKTEEKENTSEQAQEPVEITDEEKVDEKTAVVNVNGDEIKGEKYNPIYAQLKTSMHGYGQDVSDLDKLKEQTISVLVEQQLIKQEAEKNGLTVTDKEIQSQFDSIKKENGEQLTAVLDQFQLTEDDFKDQLADDIITKKYIEETFDIKVSDKEVKEYYDKLKEQSEDIEELEKVEDQIKAQLTQKKSGDKLQEKVEELKKKAEVEKLI